jgi:hypothetical protein
VTAPQSVLRFAVTNVLGAGSWPNPPAHAPMTSQEDYLAKRPQRIILTASFHDKDQVKKLRAFWDPRCPRASSSRKGCWCVDANKPGIGVAALARWLPADHPLSAAHAAPPAAAAGAAAHERAQEHGAGAPQRERSRERTAASGAGASTRAASAADWNHEGLAAWVPEYVARGVERDRRDGKLGRCWYEREANVSFGSAATNTSCLARRPTSCTVSGRGASSGDCKASAGTTLYAWLILPDGMCTACGTACGTCCGGLQNGSRCFQFLRPK